MSFGKTRVLISGGLVEGGVRTHVHLLCAALRAAGAEVTVASSATNWPVVHLTALRRMGVSVHTTPWGFGRWSALSKVHALVEWHLALRKDFDVLYCVGYGRMHLILRRFLRAGGRTIFHEIVDAPPQDHPMIGVASQMDLILANSRDVAARWTKLAPSVPVRAIPFLTEHGPSTSRGSPAAGDRELRAVFLGRLVRHKRVDWLVREWAAIERTIGRARLDIYGADYAGDRLLKQLQNEVEVLGLSDRVALHGPYDGREALATILSSADLLVLPSLYEGLPLVLVEAMAAGVPIVATEAGGTRELGDDNPDVVITGIDATAYLSGMSELVSRIRSGRIDRRRLQRWTRDRYGPEVVGKAWMAALLNNKA